MSFADPEPRDAHYETDAALDHYFYHSNTAPFVATRLAQRFGISNPSPGYMERIVAAFRSGSLFVLCRILDCYVWEVANMAT
jgi:cullin-associated NEDD8-dissociated protein 1